MPWVIAMVLIMPQHHVMIKAIDLALHTLVLDVLACWRTAAAC
jgi:hypothetical protein